MSISQISKIDRDAIELLMAEDCLACLGQIHDRDVEHSLEDRGLLAQQVFRRTIRLCAEGVTPEERQADLPSALKVVGDASRVFFLIMLESEQQPEDYLATFRAVTREEIREIAKFDRPLAVSIGDATAEFEKAELRRILDAGSISSSEHSMRDGLSSSPSAISGGSGLHTATHLASSGGLPAS